MNRDEALRIVDALYAAALGEAEFPVALSLISDVLDGDVTTLEFMNRRERAVVHFEAVRLDPHKTEVYLRDWGATSSRAQYMLDTRHRIGFDQLFITEEEMDRDPYYADFLGRNGLRYFISANCPIDGDVQGLISVQRLARVRGVSDEHIRTMELLSPHINRALRLFWTRRRHEIDPGYLDRMLAGHGLTPAERRLAAALACGETPVAYARRTSLSINTVYTHYRRIKDKLDASRQAELVTRLRSL